jgi:hypothetical protein
VTEAGARMQKMAMHHFFIAALEHRDRVGGIDLLRHGLTSSELE